MSKTRTAERRLCPDEFQQAIDERFGLNRFGTSNFRMAWGETETMRVAGLHGYEDRLLCGNVPCWNLMRWRPPEAFGTPDLFDIVNRDPDTGLCILGEYPYEGNYDVLQPLMAKEFKNGRLVIDAFPLSYQILDVILPLIVAAGEMTDLELQAANALVEARENKAIVDEIADRLLDEMPTRLGPVSYGKGGCKTAAITKKMDEISRVWNRLSKNRSAESSARFLPGTLELTQEKRSHAESERGYLKRQSDTQGDSRGRK